MGLDWRKKPKRAGVIREGVFYKGREISEESWSRREMCED